MKYLHNLYAYCARVPAAALNFGILVIAVILLLTGQARGQVMLEGLLNCYNAQELGMRIADYRLGYRIIEHGDGTTVSFYEKGTHRIVVKTVGELHCVLAAGHVEGQERIEPKPGERGA